jgi:hypothetical protein
MTYERRGGSGLGAAFVILIVVGAIAKFIWWIAAGLGVVLVFGLLAWLLWRASRRADDRARADAAIAARADEQHARFMAGDDRAIYGDYPPAEPPAAPPVAERLPRTGENWADYLAEQRRKALAS